MHLSSAIRLFVLQHDNSRTRQGYDYTLGRFVAAVGDRRLVEVTPEAVDDWFQVRLLAESHGFDQVLISPAPSSSVFRDC